MINVRVWENVWRLLRVDGLLIRVEEHRTRHQNGFEY